MRLKGRLFVVRLLLCTALAILWGKMTVNGALAQDAHWTTGLSEEGRSVLQELCIQPRNIDSLESILLAAKKGSKGFNSSSESERVSVAKAPDLKVAEVNGAQVLVELENREDVSRSIKIDFDRLTLVDAQKREYKVQFNDLYSDEAYLQFLGMRMVETEPEAATRSGTAAGSAAPVTIKMAQPVGITYIEIPCEGCKPYFKYDLNSYYNDGTTKGNATPVPPTSVLKQRPKEANVVYFYCDSETRCGHKFVSPVAGGVIFHHYGFPPEQMPGGNEILKNVKQAYLFMAKEAGVFNSGPAIPVIVTQTSELQWEILMNVKGVLTITLAFDAPNDVKANELRWPGRKPIRL